MASLTNTNLEISAIVKKKEERRKKDLILEFSVSGR